MGEWFAGSAGICWAQALQVLAVSVGFARGWGFGNSNPGAQSPWSRVKDVLRSLAAAPGRT